MNKKQYNNIIKASLNEDNLQCENNLEAVRTVFNNMGVALPQGDFSKVSETLATDDYMNWKSCSQEEAQEYANQGVPAIRIDETNIQLISAEETDDSVEGVATTSSVLFNNNDLVIEELEPISKEPTYYAYSRSSAPNTGSSQFIPNGTYYMNSAFTGQYLQNNSNQADNTSGLLANLGNTIKWKIEKTGSYYTIRYAADTTKYLGVASVDPDSAIVNIYTINSSTVPDYCKWTPAKGTDSVGGVVFKNLFNSRYLACAASILTRPSLGADPSIPYLQCTWRIIETSKYGNTSGYESRELGSEFSINCKVNIDECQYVTINKSPAEAMWASPRDFAYEILNGAEHIALDNASGLVTGLSIGTTRIKATHKVTLRTHTFTVYVDRYVNELINTFGFEENSALLIRNLYEKVNTYFSDKNKLTRAWMCARLLGGIVYGNESAGMNAEFKWKDVAGKVFSGSEQNYFTTQLHYSESEYESLKNAILSQHSNTSTPDFAHMQISMSARLAYKLNIDGFAANIGEFCSDEVVSYLAGWLGDATLVNDDGKTHMKNDDYCADLDAENIYRIISDDTSAIEAHNEYYASLNSITTRATTFLDHIAYSYVKSKIISRLSISGSTPLTTLSNDYPDTYNFLMSLEDGLQNIGQY